MAFGRVGRYAFSSLIHCHSKGLLRVSAQPAGWLERCTGAKRHLLSEENVIKLQDFQRQKGVASQRVKGYRHYYLFELIKLKLRTHELIPEDKLKWLLHSCHSAEDLVTARDAIYRYHEQNPVWEFGVYSFGTLFMRLCYERGAEEMAAAALTDQRMKGFFGTTSFNIAIDMLFTKECYERALDVLREMKKQGVLFNRDTYMLACATCYKVNSPEMYRICSTLVEEGRRNITRKAYCFAVALAVRQNDVEKAQSLYSQILDKEGTICQNLKVVISAMSGAVEDCLCILHAALLPKSSAEAVKVEFSQEVVDLLRLRCECGPYTERLEQIVHQLEQAGRVTEKSLDYMLCHCTNTPKRRASPRFSGALRSSLWSE